MKSVFLNLLLFKIAWTASVFGAAAGLPLAGLTAVSLAVAFHLFRARDARAEVCLLAGAAIVGLTWESTLVATGVLEYGDGAAAMAPYWIVGMWVLFATTLNVGMRWLQKSTLVAAVAGAIGGPLSFFAGAKTGAVTLTDPFISLAVIAAGWAVLLPAMTWLAARFDGHSTLAAAQV